MDSLFHFVFPIIAALAARLHLKHPIKSILSAATLTVLIDVDHFIGLPREIFHNIFVTIMIPAVLLLLAFHLRANRYVKGFLFLLLIFLSSHVFIDMFSNPVLGNGIGISEGSGVALFYPLSDTLYSINFNIKIPLPTIESNNMEGYLVSSLGFGILMYFIIILVPCIFLDDIIEISERNHEKIRRAAKTFFNRLLKD